MPRRNESLYRGLRRLSAVAVIAGALVIGGCSNLPTDSNPNVDPSSLGRPLDDPPSLRFGVSDAKDRIAVGLPQGTDRDVLSSSLQLLDTRLQAGYSTPVRTALGTARSSLAAYSSHNGDVGVAADLTAIGLALNVVDYALSLAGSQ